MFGVDETKPPPVPRRGWITVVLVGIELLLGFAAGAVLFSLWLVGTPEGLRHVIARLVGDAPIDVTFEDVAISPASTWYRPAQWRVIVSGLNVKSEAANVRITWLDLGFPDLVKAWATREVRFDHLEASGLDIQTTVRPPIPWQPKETALALLASEVVHVRGGHLRVDREEGFDAVIGHEIEGDLTDVRYAPGPREIWANGSLRASGFDYGLAKMYGIEVPAVVATGGDVEFKGAKYAFGDGGGSISGEITSLQHEPDVHLTVHLDARAEALFDAATGKTSPFTGRLIADLDVVSNGARKGDAQMEGTAKLHGAKLVLGDDINGFVLALLKQAPWIQVDTINRVLFGDMEGRIKVRPGSVEIERLLYHSYDADKPSQIEIGGKLDEGLFNFVVRLVPRKHPEKAGFGIVIFGQPHAVDVRLAHKVELLDLKPLPPKGPKLDLFGEPEAPRPTLLQSVAGLFKKKKNEADAADADEDADEPDAFDTDFPEPRKKVVRPGKKKSKDP
jgi:hypothetical protein